MFLPVDDSDSSDVACPAMTAELRAELTRALVDDSGLQADEQREPAGCCCPRSSGTSTWWWCRWCSAPAAPACW